MSVPLPPRKVNTLTPPIPADTLPQLILQNIFWRLDNRPAFGHNKGSVGLRPAVSDAVGIPVLTCVLLQLADLGAAASNR